MCIRDRGGALPPPLHRGLSARRGDGAARGSLAAHCRLSTSGEAQTWYRRARARRYHPIGLSVAYLSPRQLVPARWSAATAFTDSPSESTRALSSVIVAVDRLAARQLRWSATSGAVSSTSVRTFGAGK